MVLDQFVNTDFRVCFKINTCGERGIRTLDPISHGIHAFQACAFDHSAISPSFFLRGLNYKKKMKVYFFSLFFVKNSPPLFSYSTGTVISPRKERCIQYPTSSFDKPEPNKYINLVNAASKVIS